MKKAVLVVLFAALTGSLGVFLMLNPVGITMNVTSRTPAQTTVPPQPSLPKESAAFGKTGIVDEQPQVHGDSIPNVARNSTPISEPAVTPNGDAENLNLPPATVLENMRTTIRSYGSMFGGNPVGSNEEITRALNGDNPKQVKFLKPDGNRVNQKGELVDSWGTPYFFHQLSGKEMEIRSAGPDRKMWTEDDLIMR